MDNLFPIKIVNAATMIAFGEQLAGFLRDGDVVALVGDLGAGKTHITQGIAKGLGYDTEVTSPTFALVNEYVSVRSEVIHFDLYRLELPEELLEIGWEEYLEREAVLIVEWADRFPELMPAGTHCLHIERVEGGRELFYSKI